MILPPQPETGGKRIIIKDFGKGMGVQCLPRGVWSCKKNIRMEIISSRQ